MDTNVVKVEVRGKSWVAKAANGEIVARGEQHTSKADARRAAEAVFPGLEVTDYVPPRKYTVAEIPESEPVFVVRARDKFAVDAVGRYLDVLYDEFDDGEGIDDDNTYVKQVEEIHTAFKEFAKENPKLMKVPD